MTPSGGAKKWENVTVFPLVLFLLCVTNLLRKGTKDLGFDKHDSNILIMILIKVLKKVIPHHSFSVEENLPDLLITLL